MRRLLLLSLMILLTAPAWGQSATPSPSDSAKALAIEYGIELETLYEGSLVAQALDELLRAAQAEATETAKAAYDEGFKAATLLEAPKRAAAEARAKALNLSLKDALASRDTKAEEVEGLKRWLYVGATVGGIAFIVALIL